MDAAMRTLAIFLQCKIHSHKFYTGVSSMDAIVSKFSRIHEKRKIK